MPGAGEHAHVGADLSDHRFGGALGDAGDRGGQRDGGLPGRAQLGLDRVRKLGDVLVQEVQMGQDRADDQRVVRFEATLKRLPERRDLGAQLPFGQVGEHPGVGGSGHQRVEHRATRDTEDVGGDAVELDPGVLQRLVQPVGLALALGDLRLAIPGQRPQPALGLGRHEAAAQQAGLHQLTKPLRVRHVGLAPGHVLDVPRVAQRQLEVVFEDVPDRQPVHAGGLHRHMRDAVALQPVRQRQQACHGRGELGQMRHALPLSVRDPHARRDLRLMHVEARDALKHLLKHPSHRPSRGRRSPNRRPAGLQDRRV